MSAGTFPPEDGTPRPRPGAAPRRPAGGPGAARRRGEPIGRHSKPPPRRRGRRIVAALGVVLALGLVAGAAGAGYLWYRYNQIGREDLDLAEAASGEPKNYLIVGSDDRSVVSASDPDADAFLDTDEEQGGHRSDTIMILRVDPGNESIDMVSFPRDLWVPIAGTTYTEKINAAYNGGAQRLIDTIKQNFDIDVHHYVEIDIASFKGIVSAVGGVPMHFDTPMRDTHSGLYVDQAGCTTLDGEQAIAFARSRYLEYQDELGRWMTDGTGDLGRVSRQQLFLRKVIDHAAGRLASFDLRAANDILSSTADNLRVDDEMDLGAMIDLGRHFSDFTGDRLVTHTLPVKEIHPGDALALQLDAVAAQPILNVFRGLPADYIGPESVILVVENGSGIAGQAQVAADAFRALGFQVEGTGNAAEQVGATVVRYAPGAGARAVVVAEHLPAGTRLAEDPDLLPGSVTLVTGPGLTAGSVSRDRVEVDLPPTTTVPGATTTVVRSTDPEVIDEPIGVVPEQDPAAACS